MPPIRLSKREQTLAMVTLGAFVFYVFYQFLLVPKWTQIEKLKGQARKVRLDLSVAEQKIKILETVEKRFGEIKQQEKTAPLATEEKSLEVLRALAGTTSRSRLKLLSIRPIIDKKAEGLKFELTCRGSYRQLYDFLKVLHDLDILILIDQLNVTGRTGQQGVPLEVKMALTAHL